MAKPILTAGRNNEETFPDILKLYVPLGGRVLDMTFGNGVFWKNVLDEYEVVRNDKDPRKGDFHEDFRETSWEDQGFDAVILDPPYIFGAGGCDSVMDEQYGNNEYRAKGSPGTGAILDLYVAGIQEAKRLLRRNGVLIVKCMDLISGGKQRRVSIWIWSSAQKMGFTDEDQFVTLSKTVVMRHKYQLHARKNHSYFWVFRKPR